MRPNHARTRRGASHAAAFSPVFRGRDEPRLVPIRTEPSARFTMRAGDATERRRATATATQRDGSRGFDIGPPGILGAAWQRDASARRDRAAPDAPRPPRA